MPKLKVFEVKAKNNDTLIACFATVLEFRFVLRLLGELAEAKLERAEYTLLQVGSLFGSAMVLLEIQSSQFLIPELLDHQLRKLWFFRHSLGESLLMAMDTLLAFGDTSAWDSLQKTLVEESLALYSLSARWSTLRESNQSED